MRYILNILLGISIISCNSNNDSSKGMQERQEKLSKLEQEEKGLIEELKSSVQPRVIQHILDQIETAKKDAKEAKDWLDGTDNTIFSLHQTSSNVADMGFRTNEHLSQILNRLQRNGFKAANKNEAIESLEKWKKLLKSINEQHTLRKELGKS